MRRIREIGPARFVRCCRSPVNSSAIMAKLLFPIEVPCPRLLHPFGHVAEMLRIVRDRLVWMTADNDKRALELVENRNTNTLHANSIANPTAFQMTDGAEMLRSCRAHEAQRGFTETTTKCYCISYN